MFCKFSEKSEFMIGILDFPQCFLLVSREKRIYNWNFGLLEVSWQVLGSPEGLLAAPGLALEGFSWISLDFHGFLRGEGGTEPSWLRVK